MIIDKDTFFKSLRSLNIFLLNKLWHGRIIKMKVALTSFILWMINQLQIYVAGGEL